MNSHVKQSWWCYKCKSRRTRENNPEKYVYRALKDNAKRRGKHFDLTFDEFLAFLKENPEYMKKKGRKVKSLQIDRINPQLGYTKGNIQSITLRENIYKYHNEEKFDFSEIDDSINFEPLPF